MRAIAQRDGAKAVQSLCMTPEIQAATVTAEAGRGPGLRDTLLSPEELAQGLELSKTTLATWRCKRVGPPFVKIGRKIWYPKDRVLAWMEANLHESAEEGSRDGSAREERKVVLPVSNRRPQLLRANRFGRHRTKQEQGRGDRARTP